MFFPFNPPNKGQVEMSSNKCAFAGFAPGAVQRGGSFHDGRVGTRGNLHPQNPH